MATLSESGRQPTLVSHPAKFASVVALGSKVFPDFQPTLPSESSDEDSRKSAATSAEQILTTSSTYCRENALPESSTSSTDQTTSGTSPNLRPSSGTYNETQGIQLDSLEVDEELDDEGLKELLTDYERRKEERKKEQDLAVLERQRLEEILRICSEYDQQQETQKDSNKAQPVIDERRESTSRGSWGSGTKIKTNGSLTSSGIYSRRSDDVFASNADSYIINAVKQSNRNAESLPYVINTAKLANRVAESDSIQSQSTATCSDRTAGKSFTRILKIADDMMEANDWNTPSEFQAKIPLKGSEQSDMFKLSSTDLSDDIDDDNISTDCFQEESTFSVVSNDPSEHSFQATSPTLNGNRNRYDGNGNVIYIPTEALSERLEGENSRWKSSKSAPGRHSRGNRYQESVEDVKNRIQVLQLRIIDIKNLEEKTLTEAELELLQWEYRTLIEQLQREKDRMAVINHQQMELLFEAAREREEAERQMESERRRLEELEGRLEETRKRCLSLGINPDDDVTLKDSVLGELIVKDIEEVEQQRHLFDDLEFHLLEMETRREEEREPQQRKLTAELNQLKHSCSLVEETLLQLNEQKSSLVSQVKSDVTDLEKERLLLVEDFRKEKKKLFCLLNATEVNVGISEANQLFPLNSSHLPTSPYTSKAKQRIERTEFKDAFHSDDEFLPKTPSSTASVLRRLQELEHRDPALQKFTENKDPGVSDGDDEIGVADDQSFLSSSFSVDRLKSWLETDQSFDSKARFYSGSDEGASVRSTEDELDRLLNQNADRYSFGTGCSSQSKEQPDGKDSIDPSSSSDGHHYVKNRQSSAEGTTGGMRKWTRTDASVDDQSASATNNATMTEAVVMRTKHKVQSRPMTRYLPVRGSCDLDLRQFIESSGHRVDGNPHVHLTPSTCRGYLVKMGSKFRLWHRRWFVLDRMRRSVIYYADQSAKKVRGCVLFSAIEDVFVDHLRTVRSPSPKLTFCLKTTVKNFYLVAPSPETMRIWIDVLFTGAEGYQGFS